MALPISGTKCTKSDANIYFNNSLDKNRVSWLISAAKKEIIIAQFMYFSSDLILQKLIDAATRGVTIKIYADEGNLTEEPVPSESVIQLVKSQKFIGSTIKERFEILQAHKDFSTLNYHYVLASVLNNSINENEVKFSTGRFGPDSKFHIKYILVDQRYLITSSGNFSFSGLGYNYENTAYYSIADSPKFVEPFICASKYLFTNIDKLGECSTGQVLFITPLKIKDKKSAFDLITQVFANAKNRIWVTGNQFGTNLFIDRAKQSPVDFRILTGTNVCGL